MNLRRKSVRFVLFAIVASMITLAFAYAGGIHAVNACVPSFKYYVNKDNPSPPNFYRSAAPFVFTGPNYDFLQTVTVGGGVISKLTPVSGGTPPYADLGIAYTFGKLGDIASIPVTGSGTYNVNIWIDMNSADDGGGNGPFFSWSGDTFAGLGGDDYGLGTAQITNSGVITPLTSFSLVAHGGTYTIGQLASGAVVGIDSNTIVGFWFGIVGDPATTRQFEIDTIGGQSLVCLPTPPKPASVGGEWSPIAQQTLAPMNALQLVGPWIALVLLAAASAVVAYRRLFKKHW